MIKLGVCFCKPDVMSVCDPQGQNQFLCDFYEKHRFANCCASWQEDIGGHCWNRGAQDAGYHPDSSHVVRAKTEAEIEESNQKLMDDLDEALGEINVGTVPAAKPVRRTCLDCGNDPGCPLVPNEAYKLNKSLASLTDTDYYNIASKCAAFINRGATMVSP